MKRCIRFGKGGVKVIWRRPTRCQQYKVNTESLNQHDAAGAAERSYTTSKERWLHGRRRAERSYSTFKVRRGGHEEIPFVQGKEQRLHFTGAAVKRYPTSKVRETQVRR